MLPRFLADVNGLHPTNGLHPFSQVFAALAFSRLVGNRVTGASLAAGTDIKSLQADSFDGFAAPALGGIRFVELACAVFAARTEDRLVVFDLEDVHRNKVFPARALPGF